MDRFTAFGEWVEALRNRIGNLDELPDEDPDARCSLCDGYGHIIDEKGARPCSCVMSDVARAGIEHARIPKRFEKAALDNFEVSPTLRPAMDFVEQYVKGYSPDNATGLYIHGGPGYGKTHLAIGILKALIKRGFDGVFYNVVSLIDEIRSTFDPKNENNPKGRLMRDMRRQIFVLDDFGVQKTSPFVIDRLYALFNQRYQDCQTLILTSNFRLEDLHMKVEPRLYSRMLEMLQPLEIKTGDYRRRLGSPFRKANLRQM